MKWCPSNPTPEHTATAIDSPETALLRLLQLVSPALPVGAYAYSQGLETAVAQAWINDEASAAQWIGGLLRHPLGLLDAPVLVRLYRAWTDQDVERVKYWNDYLYAARESGELQQEDRHLGTALARLLADLDLAEASSWRNAPRVCFATLFSLAAARWGISLEHAVQGYLWTWTENQVAAAIRLIPLGQTSGQRILSTLLPEIIATAQRGIRLNDDEVGCAATGLGLVSAWHEIQYTRLFRS